MADNYQFKDATGATLITRAKETASGIFSNFVHLMTGGVEVDSTNPLPVGGLAINASDTLTMPNTTTTYAIGDLMGQNTNGSNVTPLTFTVSRTAGSFTITGGRVESNRTSSTTVGQFRLHLYYSAPTILAGAGNGDDAVYTTVVTGATIYLGALDFNLDRQHVDGYVGTGLVMNRSYIIGKLASGTTIRGLVEARNTYARSNNIGGTAAEYLKFYLDVIQN